jgi:hypothetical protein
VRGRARFGLVILGFLLGAAMGARDARARVGEALPQGPLPVSGEGRGTLSPHAVPDIDGPGHVTTTGRVWMKSTNIGYMGNPFPALSSDPGGQWPGPSGVEYLFNWSLWVGARVPGGPADPNLRYRVTSGIEWRPPSLDPADRIHQAFEGTVSGLRDFDDDGDGRYDEEWLNGRDDDGDGLIDEDFGAVGQGMHSFDLRDDTPQSVGFTGGETHAPLGLLVHQRTLSFTEESATDLVGVEYLIVNDSGQALDSVYVGFLVDQDVGPVNDAGYWSDDMPEPRVPQQNITRPMDTTDARYDARTDYEHPGGFCTLDRIAVRGFTMTDRDGDGGATPGASAFLLLDHTTDVRGLGAPRQVGFRAYRALRATAPFGQGGLPVSDRERYELLSLREGTSANGTITARAPLAEGPDDYLNFGSVGPFVRLAPGDTVRVVVGFLVRPVDASVPPEDPAGNPHPERYADLNAAALRAQLLYRGRHETPPPGVPTPPARGWETPLKAPPGVLFAVSDCHTDSTASGGKDVNDRAFTWMDFDCDACTGVPRKLPRRWVVGGPPPGPELRLTPADRAIVVEWDNRSETVADRLTGLTDSTAYKRGQFLIWGYQLWRAGGYTRPVGSIGPTDDLWELVAEYALHDALRPLPDSVDTNQDGRFDAVVKTAPLLLDRERGTRVFPQDVPPVPDPATGDTLFVLGERRAIDAQAGLVIDRNYRVPVYPVGRWRVVDRGVLNGFNYFYSVVAVDSTGFPGVGGTEGTLRRREGRHFAVESQGVAPQVANGPGGGTSSVYVVPNPYRGRAAWDLTPNAGDPTGTHVDFYNLPAGPWTVRIFTMAGDLVQTLKSSDVLSSGRTQQDSAEDGQASWDLVSRNGQDVASGIYLFSVEASDAPTQRGKFVLIR